MKKNSVFFYLSTLLVTVFLLMTFTTLISYLTLKPNNSKGQSLKEFNVNPSEVTLKEKKKEDLKIKVYISKTKSIKEMDIEEYIKGVVAAEMPAEFHIEALKAQAVAARTYALTRMKGIGGQQCTQSNEGDICDTVHCQVYISKEERFSGWPNSKREEYWNKIEEAVAKTKGEVVTYNGSIAKELYYFAVSSGKTEDAEDVFSQAVPYLQSVDSPGEEGAPKFNSSVSYSYSSFAKIINSYYPNSIPSSNSLKNSIKIKSRTSAGSVKELQVGKTTITGTKFRSMLGLNSTNFSFVFNKDTIDIVCKGYGHGVGMSQWGANAFAKSGKTYEDILTHYYKGINIKKYTEL
ncbi:stage II sporulation protein D [Clostridium sp. MSJ-11]|uniref:Stage II sporulation protein D n=1 Tax=Clostridium mobile TaxID=2841512 RepID=A0ABS6EMX3_9CLOT|nr:stage II sporulation protein D [Clostridium mobile]MBU5486112.1 stage II sporulation protein D [Clostridium mobile]